MHAPVMSGKPLQNRGPAQPVPAWRTRRCGRCSQAGQS